MHFKGKSWKFPDDVDTDVIIPARYLNTIEPDELAAHVMEDIDPSFAGSVKASDIIVAGKNFGCGSSREHAPIAIKAAGVSCVIAESYARIFFRNAINIGLPVIEAPDAARESEPGDVLEIDTEEGWIVNTRTGKSYEIKKYDAFIQEIIASGGLMEAVTKRVEERRKQEQAQA